MKAVKQIVRHYYKYVETPWTKPILSENGIIGGNSFAVTAKSEYSSSYKAWKAFDGSLTTGWEEAGETDTAWYLFYSPTPIKITTIGWALYPTVQGIRNYNLLASNDNTTFINLGSYTNDKNSYNNPTVINNNNYYKYYKIQATYSYTSSRIYEFNIVATYSAIEEATSEEYDFYKDVDEYKVPKISDTYYGVNQ